MKIERKITLSKLENILILYALGGCRMKLTVNGKPLEIEKSINIKELLSVAKAEQPEYVTVQLNGEFIDHKGFEDTFVKDGDTVEFLYFMGGGAR
jgi:sulfur carrier protein